MSRSVQKGAGIHLSDTIHGAGSSNLRAARPAGKGKRIASAIVLFFTCVIILCFACQKRPEKNRGQIRTGCFAVFGTTEWLDITLVDAFTAWLNDHAAGTVLIHPPDMYYPLLSADSARHPDYIIDFARRIQLETVLLVRSRMISQDHYAVRIEYDKLQDSEASCVWEDTLCLSRSILFFDAAATVLSDWFRLTDRKGAWNAVPPVTIWKHYGTGRVAQINGKNREALNAFERVIQKDTSFLPLCLHAAALNLEQIASMQSNGQYVDGRLHQVEERLSRLERSAPGNHLVMKWTARCLMQRSHWNRAKRVLENVYAMDRNDPELLLWISRLHHSRYRDFGFRTRQEILQQALKSCPGYLPAYLAMGELYYLEYRFHQAEAVYRRALRINPASIDALQALGKLTIARNQRLEIIDIYRTILTIDPDYADAYYNLGIAYQKDGKTDEAVRFFERTLALNGRPDAHLYLAALYMKKGDREKGLFHLRERMRLRQGQDDPFAEEARKTLVKWNHQRSEQP